ncbi:hypothetical protein BKA67DRAFT_669267 [Truncatella angustata]|uniref:DUF7905 domain-containing protein n=1 Tax=Truncatella angustata TaxID=152316 RepID=A0A9P8UCZ7_9PEZI|nr:uncharacterized protein BKA67DRAFT_669267 [Truncatella angustata]KAH6646507.1 hypothetical protein BKA67DRAFT_669267 [Truncatella angustata]
MEDLISFRQAVEVIFHGRKPDRTAALTDENPSRIETSLLHSSDAVSGVESSDLIDLIDPHGGDFLVAPKRPTLEKLLQRSRQQILLPPLPIVEQWVDEKKHNAQIGQPDVLGPRGKAYLFLSHDKDMEKGVINAVYLEMEEFASGRKDIFFEVQGPVERPYLYMEAPSQDLVAECLDEARTCADDIVHDKSVKFDLVFLETPASSQNLVQVQVVQGHPQLVDCLGAALGQNPLFNKYISQQLAAALKKAGRIKDMVNLRVRFGHYLLTSKPQGLVDRPSVGLDQFSEIIRHGRTKGEFQTQIGNLEDAIQVLRIIKNSGDMFLSHDIAEMAADVRPEFYLDGVSRKWRIETRLRHKGETLRGQSSQSRASAFDVLTIRAIELSEKARDSHLDFKVLSLRQGLDWKVETVTGETIKNHGYDSLKSEIRSARIRFSGSSNMHDEDYPRIHFMENAIKARSLEQVTIRSVFRFRYSPAPYQIEFTIHRTWPNVDAMGRDQETPLTSFGITVYGEHWGETRASEIARTGQGWGPELENLLCISQSSPGNENGAEVGAESSEVRVNGEGRAQSLLNVIHDIRRALTA